MKYWFEVKEQEDAIKSLTAFVEKNPYVKVRILSDKHSSVQKMVISLTTNQNIEGILGVKRLARRPRGAMLSKYQLSFYQNMQLWFDLYLTYNDNNERHALNSFDNHNFQSVSQLVDSNVTRVREILERGCTKEDILQDIPWAAEVVSKA